MLLLEQLKIKIANLFVETDEADLSMLQKINALIDKEFSYEEIQTGKFNEGDFLSKHLESLIMKTLGTVKGFRSGYAEIIIVKENDFRTICGVVLNDKKDLAEILISMQKSTNKNRDLLIKNAREHDPSIIYELIHTFTNRLRREEVKKDGNKNKTS